ncbi:NAD(P)-dependent alcohol dehydrogenase [Chromohalobacter israelensis]|uniref:NAD(P)-dependent alcohol dehydrogenase n=1 Tax=Chromohalobacter israelensis TaxID=141390 RepID=UPI000555154C|nr:MULTISPECIES: NAD(P)-dependent alcohol dehydrogenase [Chromohalobacter]MBZ5875775.1 NAD(P)-dependent alcohol dehydrogenase [Chromohalobacter salexigens]MDF9436013.1 NAD(P)-dependent alcohol dehydrogenase [Chromohalobacter israelensis]MDO0947391.1 NAD(P)-dependent alcohol dehydrogenase [Chromohalobacter salexigens]PWW35645.1 D-xylulose reductase [Chromohalobacter salexigens]
MKAKALVLEKQRELSLRDIDLPDQLGPDDVRIRIHTVGICGSDVHYYTHGRIGPFVVREPMVLGHEASGVITEVGSHVSHLKVGERVCMEPGIPDPTSRAAKLGVYNVDPGVRFWATPPVHGCLTPEVIHPAAFTFALPDSVSFAEGAMIEPFAIGMQAVVKARMQPGDVCVVTGAGPIGLMVALAALAGGASEVLVSDLVEEKLAIAGRYAGITPVNVSRESLRAAVDRRCGEDWGADVVFEASGSPRVYDDVLACTRPAGAIVLVGMPVEPVTFDIVSAQAKELRIETVFRYANVYDRAIDLIAAGKVDLKPLISETFDFDESIAAFERAASARPHDVKLQITLDA